MEQLYIINWKVVILLSLLIASFTFQANAKKKESYYQDIHCDNLGGKAEYKLEDRTRIDCLTDTKAIEHDFAPKWAFSCYRTQHPTGVGARAGAHPAGWHRARSIDAVAGAARASVRGFPHRRRGSPDGSLRSPD